MRAIGEFSNSVATSQSDKSDDGTFDISKHSWAREGFVSTHHSSALGLLDGQC